MNATHCWSNRPIVGGQQAANDGNANLHALSNSGGNQLLQGTKVSYGGTASFNAGVGEKARADARIILEGIKNTTTQIRTQESNYVVWQKQVNQGTSAETLVLPSFTGPAKPTFSAPGGLSVQIATGDFKSQINTLGVSAFNQKQLTSQKILRGEVVHLVQTLFGAPGRTTPRSHRMEANMRKWATDYIRSMLSIGCNHPDSGFQLVQMSQGATFPQTLWIM